MNPREQQRQSRVLWFEIPSHDFDRATRFYESIFSITLKKHQMDGNNLGVFQYEPPAISGCVIHGDHYTPGNNGPVIYVNADPSLNAVLERVPAAGGKVLLPRTALPEGMGFFAHILDTEGNRVGLHAMQ